MNDKNNRPPGDGPEGAVEAELRRRERAGPGRDAGPARTTRQSPGAGPGGPGPQRQAECRAADPEALYRRIEQMIDEKGGRIVAEIDHVAEQVRPVAQALETISARIEDEKRVVEIQRGLMEELRAERVRRERWEEQRKRRRRYLWGSAAVLDRCNTVHLVRVPSHGPSASSRNSLNVPEHPMFFVSLVFAIC